MIYQTVPDSAVKGPKGNKFKVLAYLRSNHSIFFKASELASIGGYRKSSTFVEVRKAITELILLGHPIISSVQGFCYTESPENLLLYINDLELRKVGLDRRINSLRRVYEKLSSNSSVGDS